MIKKVRLTDKASFGCKVNPFNGNFVVDIEGQIANIKDYSIPDDLGDVSIFAAGHVMLTLMCQDAFSDFREFIEKQHPDMFEFNMKSKSKKKSKR